MIGWAQPAPGLMQRVTPPVGSTAALLADRIQNNAKMSATMTASEDEELDVISMEKSLEEIKAGVVLGPYIRIGDIPYKEFCLAPRRGIWEKHGDSLEFKVRNIDNLLSGGQNATAGMTHAHRPTDARHGSKRLHPR